MLRLRLIIFILTSAQFAFCQPTEGLRMLNGANLFVKTIGEGATIVVVHGGPGMNHSYLTPHLDALAKNHQVVYYDQRACGKSSTPSSDSISLSMFVADIEALRNDLKKDKIYILAHSWGAIPAVSYANQFPQHVSGIIFCNGVPLSRQYDEEIRNSQLAKMNSLDSTDRSIIKGSPNFKAGKPTAYKKLLLLSFRNSFYKDANFKKLNLDLPNNYVEASKALFTGLGKDLGQYDYYEVMKSFPFPILILHGKADAVPLVASQRIKDMSPNNQLEVFKKSGHFIFIEERKKFNAVVSRFTR